ncbi:MAG: hypothetical protein LBM77_05715 [Spirochaetaceae bacterium]|jgi:hypothetical protein|nr:hypothetical protein [Spirochaetaceae bacterium]
MQTLTVSISDVEYSMFGMKTKSFNFTDFVDIISRELMRQNLNSCVRLAEKYGLSEMTLEDINNEIEATRANRSGNAS